MALVAAPCVIAAPFLVRSPMQAHSRGLLAAAAFIAASGDPGRGRQGARSQPKKSLAGGPRVRLGLSFWHHASQHLRRQGDGARQSHTLVVTPVMDSWRRVPPSLTAGDGTPSPGRGRWPPPRPRIGGPIRCGRCALARRRVLVRPLLLAVGAARRTEAQHGSCLVSDHGWCVCFRGALLLANNQPLRPSAGPHVSDSASCTWSAKVVRVGIGPAPATAAVKVLVQPVVAALWAGCCSRTVRRLAKCRRGRGMTGVGLGSDRAQPLQPEPAVRARGLRGRLTTAPVNRAFPQRRRARRDSVATRGQPAP